MIPVRIQTLIVTAAPAPSIIVLQPVEETQNGKSRVVPIWTAQPKRRRWASRSKRRASPVP